MFIRIFKKAIKYCLIAYGIATILVGVNDAAYQTMLYFRCDSDVEGKVSDFYERDNEEGEEIDPESTSLYPIVEYFVENTRYQHHSAIQFGDYPYKTGTIARVLYSKNNPGISMLNIEIYGYGKAFIIQFLIAISCLTAAALIKTDKPIIEAQEVAEE